jgi:demethylmenaquinone methyltransferase/2-methoxy-6-polyprenyl-1,4-benzoquinol methylase
MFSSIAPRYDFLNHLLSLNIDKLWRRRAVRLMQEALAGSNSICLDLCCGTGDFALEMSCQGSARIVACDFSHPMLKLNQAKVQRRGAMSRVLIAEADALTLPFRSGTFEGLAIAFGLRNLESTADGLKEMWRVLKPRGQLIVLEFSKPANALFDRLFQLYFFSVLPRIGALVSRHNDAYTYLPRSVSRFPDQLQLCTILVEYGFEHVGYVNLSGGIAAIHYGQKPCDRP